MGMEGKGERLRAQSLKALSSRAHQAINQMLAELPEEASIEVKTQNLLSFIRERANILPDNRDLASEIEARIHGSQFGNQEEMAAEIARCLVDIVANTYPSLEDLEKHVRDMTAEKSGWTMINEALSYELYRNDIFLHVPLMLTKTPFEMVRLFEEGLRTLAHNLTRDEKYADAQRIVGHSWLVAKYPKIVEKMGFTIDSIDQERGSGSASMSRGAFLEKYGE